MHLTGPHLQEEGFDILCLFLEAFRWKTHHGLARFTQTWESGLRMAEAIRARGGCDLVEAHEPLSLGCVWARRSFPGCRVIGFSYGIEQRARAAMLRYRESHRISTPWKGRLTSLLQSWLSTAGLRRCDHVVCSNSEDLAYLASKGIPTQRLTRHFSGVADALLAQGAVQPVADKPRILFVGAWIDRKGTAEVSASLTQVLRARPDASFTAAGCQVPDAEVLRSFPADVCQRVRVIRRMESEDELARLYSSHSIFLLPSYFEGQPLVMMEAAAFGLAIITTPVCGMLDFIRDGENGLFVPVGDSEACARTLNRLLDDPALASRLGSAARREVAHHTWRDSARNLAEAYRRIARQGLLQ